MTDIDIWKSLAIADTDINTNITNINKFSSSISTTTTNITRLTTNLTDLSTTNNIFLNLETSADKLNEKLADTETKTEKAGSGFGKLLKSSLSLSNLTKGMDMADQYINTSNGLARVNDNLQTQMELQNKVNTAANRSSTSYADMAEAVTDFGGMDTFKGSNDQAIAFSELMQKALKADGSDKSLKDISGVMSDGLIKGDEFSSLISSAPMIGEAISKSTGKSSEQLQAMADQGLITADILKKAMFVSGDQINSEFEKQPKTFADVWTKIKNSAMNALNPLMQLVSDVLNSPGVQAAVNVIISALGMLSGVLSSVIGFITDNWPIVQAILIAVGIYLAYLGATAFASFMMAAAPILFIIGIIAIVIYALQSLGVSFEDIFGFIGGVVGAAVAGIYNLFLGLFDLILGAVNFIINPFLDFANFLGNLFTNPISSIIYLFQGLADNVLGVIETIASAIDKVFGSKLSKTVAGWRTGLKDKADEAVAKYAPDENYKKVVDKMDLSTDSLGLSRMDYSDTINKGKHLGKSAYSKLEKLGTSMSKSGAGIDYNKFKTGDLGSDNKPVPVEGTGNNGALDVAMNDEDLSYLRDMAERDYIANVATNTMAPNISVSFGDVHETADVNQMFGRIQKILKEQIAVAAEGVY